MVSWSQEWCSVGVGSGSGWYQSFEFPLVLCECCFSNRNGIHPVKILPNYRATVTSNGLTYATGPLSCLYCGQTVGWKKTAWPRRHCVRQVPHGNGHSSPPPPLFDPCPLWPNSWMNQDTTSTWFGGGPWPGDIALDWDPAFPPQKGAQNPPPPLFSLCLLWPNSCPSQQLVSLFLKVLYWRSQPNNSQVQPAITSEKDGLIKLEVVVVIQQGCSVRQGCIPCCHVRGAIQSPITLVAMCSNQLRVCVFKQQLLNKITCELDISHGAYLKPVSVKIIGQGHRRQNVVTGVSVRDSFSIHTVRSFIRRQPSDNS